MPMPLPSQPPPGGSTRAPAPCQPIRGSTLKATPLTVILTDWCLEKVEGEEAKIRVEGEDEEAKIRVAEQMKLQHMSKGASSSKEQKSGARRRFRSSAIVKRLDCCTMEDESGHLIKIASALNMEKTINNGFDERVCECFQLEFPIAWEGLVDPVQWPSLVDPKFELDNEDAQSPGQSVADIMAYFESEEFSSVSHYADFLYGPATQSPGNLPDDHMRQLAGLRMDNVPENPLAPPGEACNRGQESYQHESMQRDASEQEIANRSISSNSKVDGNTPSKTLSAVDEGYRSTAGCGQAEEDVDIQQENMHNCSGEHGTSSQLGEQGIEGMTPKCGAIGGSEESTSRTLRNGKDFGMPSGGPTKRVRRQKKIQNSEGTACCYGPRPTKRRPVCVGFFFLSMQSCIWRGPRLFWRQL